MREREGNVQSSKFTMYSSKIQCVLYIHYYVCVCVCVCVHLHASMCVYVHVHVHVCRLCVSIHIQKNYSSIM